MPHRSATIEDRLYDLLGDEFCGNTTMPLDHRSLKWTSDGGVDRVFVFLNDAFEVGIGYPDEWQVMLRRKEFPG